MDLQLKGKRALVTGGSRGIGKAIAKALLQEGVDVALLARNLQALADAARELSEGSGRKVVSVVANTGDDEQVKLAVASAASQLGGPIDILVNAAAEPAGYAGPPKLAEITGDFFHAEMDIKVMGYIRCAREVVAGISVAALTKNMADELGPSGINVTVVHPGVTRTERTAPLIAERARSRGVAEQVVEAQMAGGNSINRLVDASEVADVVVFLCSPRSHAINGDAIAAGGGAPGGIHY